MDGCEQQLHTNIPKGMKESCKALRDRIDNYVKVNLITLSSNPRYKYVGESYVRDHIARTQYDSFSLSGPGFMTSMRDCTGKASASAAKRLGLTPDVLYAIVGKLTMLAEENIDVPALRLLDLEVEKEKVHSRPNRRSPSPPLHSHPSPPSSPPIFPPQAEKFPPDDINADIESLLDQIGSLIFYDCLKIYLSEKKSIFN